MIPALRGPVRDVSELVLPRTGTARADGDVRDERPLRRYEPARPACGDCDGACECVLSDPTLDVERGR